MFHPYLTTKSPHHLPNTQSLNHFSVLTNPSFYPQSITSHQCAIILASSSSFSLCLVLHPSFLHLLLEQTTNLSFIQSIKTVILVRWRKLLINQLNAQSLPFYSVCCHHSDSPFVTFHSVSPSPTQGCIIIGCSTLRRRSVCEKFSPLMRCLVLKYSAVHGVL